MCPVQQALFGAIYTANECSKRNATTSFQSQIYGIKRKTKVVFKFYVCYLFVCCCCFGLFGAGRINSRVTFQNSRVSAIKILIFFRDLMTFVTKLFYCIGHRERNNHTRGIYRSCKRTYLLENRAKANLSPC